MKLLLKSANIVDPNSPANGQKMDILIENGKITSIKKNISATKNMKVIKEKGLCVSPGWFDMQAHFQDPGFEYKEDIETGAAAAASGGFTGVALMPSTLPPIHTKSEVEYVRNKARDLAVDIFPLGCISYNREGNDIAEMYDMHCSGAVAFSDGKAPVANAGLLLRALLYSKDFNGLIVTHCNDKTISAGGHLNEGKSSTMLGLKGMPAVAEELMVARNIYLAEYSGARIHISSVSTAKSVELIKQAKAKGIPVTASSNVCHVCLDDKLLMDFDTNFKIDPPLRTVADVKAVRKGLAEGVIDAIASDHAPQDEENKKVEFDHAAFGMIGLETAYAMINTFQKFTPEKLIKSIAIKPREILNIPYPAIKEGQEANLTLFNPDTKWTFEEKHIRSKSKNTPFIGQKFTGKVLGIYNKNKLVLAE